MASTSSTTRSITYDVFISFRGEDTRYSFTDHLYKALVRAGLHAFRDDDAFQLDHELKTEIKEAIKESRASVVVLSENYASSRWCLDELLLILEQRKKQNHIVLPVFYHVDPSDIRKQGRSFSVQGSNWTVDTTTRWKEALIEVAALTGMVLSGYETYETDFLKEVVETINNQLYFEHLGTPTNLIGMETVNTQLELKQSIIPAHFTGMETINSQPDIKQLSTPAHLTGTETVNSQPETKQPNTPAYLTGMETVNSPLDLKQLSTPAHLTGMETINSQLDLKELSTPTHLTGMDTRAEVINSWLKKDEEWNALAICGMGGSGKTTLAKYIYYSNKQHFECGSFVKMIGKHNHDVLELQKQLLRDVSRGKEVKISSVSEGRYRIEEILILKKVLIVLDDIDDEDELNTLLGLKLFHTQSKIIITTRRLDIHAWFWSKSWSCWVHNLDFLNDYESLELLCWHAFGSKIPMEGFEKLTKQVAEYCGGNPLALEVFGSSLFVSDEDPHERNNMIEIWRSKMNSMSSLKDVDRKIQYVLRKSFDSLPFDNHKKLFLDIACFFVGENKDMVTVLMEDLNANSGIRTLINRCLLSVSPETGELMMHQLLQDMGRKIVCEESIDPSRRSRVWHDDAYHMLRKGDGSITIEGLALDMRNIKQGMESQPLPFKTSSLKKLDKLKLLQLKHVTLTGSYKNFPQLRLLCWHGYPLETIRPGLLASTLVAIDMSYGHMETFEAPTILYSLKILNLEGCVKLVGIFELRHIPKLETLNLCSCRSLTYVCKYIGDLQSLALLDLKGCIKLFKAYSYTKNVKIMLKRLWIGGISEQRLFSLPCSLNFLHLDDCQIDIHNDVRVSFHAQSFFNLSLSCNPFEYLPNSIDLGILKTLNLCCCPNLKVLTHIPSTLEDLYVDWCTSLERITFQSRRLRLQQFSYEGCFQLSEVQGLFKLVPVAKIDEADLVQHMKWIKEFEDRRMYLVGDEITNGRFRPIQMLYEYGIMSTYLQLGINDQIVATYGYMSSSNLLSFCVPSHHENNRIQGLCVSCLYRSVYSKEKEMWLLLAKISNRTKGFTWIYNPMVYCKPRVDEDVKWLSYWPIGIVLDVGDEVSIDIIVDDAVMVSMCGASLVYKDDEVDEEEKYENSMIKEEEVIGGDLTQFEVTEGGYYLCRRNLFGSETSTRLKGLFDDNIDYPKSHGWRKTIQSRMRNYRTDMFLSGYDVYLSVSGEDPCHTFANHLYHALLRTGVRTFRKDDEINRGQVLTPEIRTTINESRAFIVVLSKNYAKSRWCLDELCLILEQKRKFGDFVLPVFYHVDPLDVRNHRGSFSVKGSKGTVDDVRRWKAALTEVANLSGMELSGPEVNFIAAVIDTINSELETRQTHG